jgi:methionyl-tRNA formyltransferase
LNLHASILPRFRGASPIQTAIASGATETGATLMRIVRRLDAGPVAEIERVPIAPLDTALEIEAKLAHACVPLLARTLPRLREGTLKFFDQEETAATYCRRLEKDDGVLDFNVPAPVLAARINGLFPWPACSIELNGQATKLGLADVVTGDAPPGKVAGTDRDGLLIGTGQRLLRLRRLQRPGGKMLETAEFLRGFSVAAGTTVASRPMPPLEAREPFRR